MGDTAYVEQLQKTINFRLLLHIYSVGREHALLAYGKIVTHGIYLLNKDILPLLKAPGSIPRAFNFIKREP